MTRVTSNTLGAGSTTGPRPRRGVRRRAAPPDLEALAALSGRITALEEQKGDAQRRSLFLDGEFALGLDLETIVRCHLKVGITIDGPALVAAYRQDQAKRAWDSALLLLSVTARTRRELERRLQRTYPPEVVALVLDRLEEGGWLDDRAFAEGYIRAKREYGRRRLLQDLLRKGVDRTVAMEVLERHQGDDDGAQQAREAAVARLARMQGVDRETAQRRLAGYLARRGYGFEIISRVLGPLLQDLPRAPRKQRGL